MITQTFWGMIILQGWEYPSGQKEGAGGSAILIHLKSTTDKTIFCGLAAQEITLRWTMPVHHLRMITWGVLKQVLMNWKELDSTTFALSQSCCNFTNTSLFNINILLSVALDRKPILIICLCFASMHCWCSRAWLEQTDVRHSATFSRLCSVTLLLAAVPSGPNFECIEILRLEWLRQIHSAISDKYVLQFETNAFSNVGYFTVCAASCCCWQPCQVAQTLSYWDIEIGVDETNTFCNLRQIHFAIWD